MKVVILFLLLTICLTNAFDISSSTVLEQTSNLDKAKEIFDNIKDSEFVKTLKSTAKWGLPLLKSMAYFAKVILGGIASESKELTYMKEQFKILNERMDVVDYKFEEVKKAIDWSVVKVQYSSYERSIFLLQHMIQELTDAPSNVRFVMIDRFLNTYSQMYNSAANKIYESLVFNDKIFSENLGAAVRQYTDNHRTKVEKFFMGNINLIFIGLQVETFYLNLQNLTSNDDYWNNQWDQRIKQITAAMERSVNEITANWHSQLEKDTETFNVQNYQQSNENYLTNFYSFLNDKFPWREWFVIIYNPISGDNVHYVSVYEGLIKFRARNHNIVVGSRDKNADYFQEDAVQRIVNGIPLWINTQGQGLAKAVLMSYLLPRLPHYTLAAVIEWGSGIWYQGNRRVYRKWSSNSGTLNIIVMG